MHDPSEEQFEAASDELSDAEDALLAGQMAEANEILDSAESDPVQELWQSTLATANELIEDAKADLRAWTKMSGRESNDQGAILVQLQSVVTAAMAATPEEMEYIGKSFQAQAQAVKSGVRVRAAQTRAKAAIAMVDHVVVFVSKVLSGGLG